MAETRRETHENDDAGTGRTDARRRRLLLWIPAAVFGSVAAALGATTFRFLRPRTDAQGPPAASVEGAWRTLAQVSELSAESPTALTVSVARVDGWAAASEERAVYVLPGEARAVLSAVCPHEQCEVAWAEESREFLCPCHDSRFGPEGARLSGPAARDLERLPSRVEGGALQIRLDADGLAGRGEA